MADQTNAATAPTANPPAQAEQSGKRTPGAVKYPYEVSKRVRIVRKNTNTILPETGTAYNTAIDYVMSIGASFAGPNNPLQLGRTIFESPEEENRIMGMILAASHTHPEWNKLLDTYWVNYQLKVPFEGVTLEAGLRYVSADALPIPISPVDYVHYLYCLKHGQVANSPEVAYKSPRIRFVLLSEEEETTRITKNIDLQDKATVRRLELVNDEVQTKAVLALLKENFEMPEVQRRVRLAEISKEHPATFLKVANDPDLLDKAFIEYAVWFGVLRRPDGSDIIIFNDTQPLGNTNEAVAFLRDPRNAAIKADIAARVEQIRKG